MPIDRPTGQSDGANSTVEALTSQVTTVVGVKWTKTKEPASLCPFSLFLVYVALLSSWTFSLSSILVSILPFLIPSAHPLWELTGRRRLGGATTHGKHSGEPGIRGAVVASPSPQHGFSAFPRSPGSVAHSQQRCMTPTQGEKESQSTLLIFCGWGLCIYCKELIMTLQIRSSMRRQTVEAGEVASQGCPPALGPDLNVGIWHTPLTFALFALSHPDYLSQ